MHALTHGLSGTIGTALLLGLALDMLWFSRFQCSPLEGDPEEDDDWPEEEK